MSDFLENDSDYSAGFDDEWTTDDDSDHDSITPDTMLSSTEGFYSDDEFDAESDSSTDEDDDVYAEYHQRVKRHLAILRTNRQIHSEASSLFYAEAVLTLEPGDIFSLARKPHILRFGYPNKMAWKHNPLKGVGKQNEGGVVSYDTPQLGGDIEPHVFAKFRKIAFDAYFDQCQSHNVEIWIDDDTHVIKKEDATFFKNLLRSSSLFRDFAKILSNSPRINLLEIELSVEINALSTAIIAHYEAESDDEEDEEMGLKLDKLEDIASQKATELFLDSKIMRPLLNLSNVRNFNFKFGFDSLDDDEAYKPPTKYFELIKAMKNKIERNFKEKMDEA